jgi:copper(I)-binding protein
MRTSRGLFAGILVLAVLAAGAFAACGDDDDDGAGSGATTSATEAGNGDGSHAASAITIEDPWVRPSTNDVSAVYMVIMNEGAEDRLVSATADVSPKVQIHEMVTEGNSQSMQEVEGGVVVPEHGSVELKPGGYHIMLMNLPEPLEVGDVVKVALSFEHAGTIDVEATVREAAQTQGNGMQHGGGS